MEEIGEAMDRAIAREVFGVSDAVLDAWPWPLPEFSTVRSWAEHVVLKLLFDERLREAYEAELDRIARKAGWQTKPGFCGHASLWVVLCADEICRAALVTLRQYRAEEQTSVLDTKLLPSL